MTTAQQTVLGDFAIESLGIDSPSYFPGYGTAFTPFRFSAYGIGDTEEEALEDCLEMMAQSAGFDFDEATEQRIRAEFGPCDTTTVADALGWSEEETEEVSDSGEGCYFHVGIRWNETAE
jgi:hypothetical protein